MKRATTLKDWSGGRTTVAPPPDATKHKSRKNTKRWCRGKAGVEHEYEWVRDERRDYAMALRGERTPDREMWWAEVCKQCQKQRSYCTGWFTSCACGHHRP